MTAPQTDSPEHGAGSILDAASGRVVVVDYGAGNLRSVARAVARTGVQPLVTADAREIERADALIVPGVGAAADTMANLRSGGLDAPILDYIASGRPFLGVCMGMQALFDVSEEGGEHRCLGVFGGRIVRFPYGETVPHMGWNTVRLTRPHPVFEDIPQDSYFYFVHSYYAAADDPGVVLGATEYGGVRFPAVVARDNVVATQFHPEKSGRFGLQVYENFLRAALGRGTLELAESART